MASFAVDTPACKKIAVVGLLVLCGNCSASATNCPDASAPGLRLNHAQVLASHNSYHVAPSPLTVVEWGYTHPPLDVQLDRGVRSFELDIWWDPVALEWKVMHVPGADEGTTCATLSDCLQVVDAWSQANPTHFPLHLILALLGGVGSTESSDSGCLYSDVEPVFPCVEEHCVGETVSDIFSCIFDNCGTEAFSVYSRKPACSTLLSCTDLAEATLGADHVVTEQDIEDVLRACSSTVSNQEVNVNDVQREAGLVALRSALDSSFPSSRRIAPEDVQGNDSYVWPEVDASRGKALFYVEGALSNGDYEDYYFGPGGAVSVQNDPTSIEGVVSGQWVRTRVDAQLVREPARQQAGLSSGAQALTTDFPPAVCPTGWEALDSSSGAFWIPGGLPVRCNPVTVPQGTECSPTLLEDPQCIVKVADTTTSAAKGSDSTTSSADAKGGGSMAATTMRAPLDGQQVVVDIRVSGIDYTLLEAVVELFNEFVTTLRELVAEEADVDSPNVRIEVREGSVVVTASITVPEGQFAESVETAVSMGLERRVAPEINGIDGIGQATVGEIAVVSFTVEIEEPAEVQESDSASPVGMSLLLFAVSIACSLS